METLETGMYIRNHMGKIEKIKSIEPYNKKYCINGHEFSNNVKKASYNIIDLIETGDYVNSSPVCSIKKDENNKIWIYTDSNYKVGILENEIETILTREQFENNCFRIGE